jgi:transposase InsO family protein
MSLRSEFVHQALQPAANLTKLCELFGISRKTGYKWLARFVHGGESFLVDRSRRPHTCPTQTVPELEDLIVRVRQDHPEWGGRKIRAVLERGERTPLPSPSTITEILWRHQLIDPQQAQKHVPFQRFEMESPNQLWQMDFKGHVPLAQTRCHPLTVLDDHSRFLIGLRACPNETQVTVQGHLTSLFREYGLPDRMLMDNASPWGDSGGEPYTFLTVWLMRLGITISHGRPYHPQTQGKDERLHRTLKAELLRHVTFETFEQSQRCFDEWRHQYNWERPHEALGMQAPAEHYQPSSRIFLETLPPLEYLAGEITRKVDKGGFIYFRGRRFYVGRAFWGQVVALRPTEIDGEFRVFYAQHEIDLISLRKP